MSIWQARSKRKSTGGRLTQARKKLKRELGRESTFTVIGEVNKKKVRCFGGTEKMKIMKTDYSNLLTKEGYKKVKITGVTDNPANRHFVRRSIITKGAIITTELGKARVTSRPGQDGVINAVLIE
ncbi:MAG: 30S ribosomal protein S8e [Candidatus Methanofastidiosum sp.]|nr:30S ribosomal protein S8e [Methanofastidiosum sp.]NYT12940.1 30S ribosomal protein S8e [Candidatus Methanofastidiosa archaeon]